MYPTSELCDILTKFEFTLRRRLYCWFIQFRFCRKSVNLVVLFGIHFHRSSFVDYIIIKLWFINTRFHWIMFSCLLYYFVSSYSLIDWDIIKHVSTFHTSINRSHKVAGFVFWIMCHTGKKLLISLVNYSLWNSY